MTSLPPLLCMAWALQAVYEGADVVYHLPTRAAFMAITDEKSHNVECAIKASAVHEAIYRENRVG